MDRHYVQQFKKGSLEMILLCLIAQKEGFGGRGVVYETYLLTF